MFKKWVDNEVIDTNLKKYCNAKMPKERSALEEVRSHIEYLKTEGSVVFSQEINSFPNTESVFQRVHFIVAPATDISPADVEGLNSFKDSLKLDRKSRHPSGHFYRTSEGHLRFGTWDYADLISGQKKEIKTRVTEITDSEVKAAAAVSGVQLATVMEQVLEGPIRVVTISPLPSLRLADLVAEYEVGFLNQGMSISREYMNLRVGLSVEQIEAIERGEFPFKDHDKMLHPYTDRSPSARARYLEIAGGADQIMQWVENSERMFGR